ncbi:MAG: hypothetical protein ACOX20_09735 [Limnochordia bacterium]|nr:hypothetical protein [Bacillota bacterium]
MSRELSCVLGLELSEAEAVLTARGMTFEVVLTSPPQRTSLSDEVRVIGLRERPDGVLLVCAHSCRGPL